MIPEFPLSRGQHFSKRSDIENMVRRQMGGMQCLTLDLGAQIRGGALPGSWTCHLGEEGSEGGLE